MHIHILCEFIWQSIHNMFNCTYLVAIRSKCLLLFFRKNEPSSSMQKFNQVDLGTDLQAGAQACTSNQVYSKLENSIRFYTLTWLQSYFQAMKLQNSSYFLKYTINISYMWFSKYLSCLNGNKSVALRLLLKNGCRTDILYGCNAKMWI